MDRNIPDVISTEIDTHPEPLSLVLVLVDLLGQYVSSEYFPLVWENYIIFEHELSARSTDPAAHGDMPCVVQLGGHFQLYYKGEVLRFDSLVRSVLALLHVVKTKLGGIVGGISIKPWFEAQYAQGRSAQSANQRRRPRRT